MNYFTMREVFVIIFLSVCVDSCLSGCNERRLISNYYSAENQILKSHGFKWKTVSSPVLCGRDCSLSPQCQSFNYHPSKHLCVLNNATRSNNLDDLVNLLGSIYYDENVKVPFFTKFETVSATVTTPTTAATYTPALTTSMSPDTSAETTKQVEETVSATVTTPTTAAIYTPALTTSMSPDTSAETTKQVEETVSATVTTPTTAAIYTPALTTSMSPDTSAETTRQVTSPATYKSCTELLIAGKSDNGINTIYPDGLPEGVQVYCDMETDGGGWVVFQRRQDGSVDFYRNWAEYQAGFGDLNNEFWLGNDILRTITSTGQWHLRIDLTDWNGNSRWVVYKRFAISGDEYRITVGLFDRRSTAGDSMAFQNGNSFTTSDRDNDPYLPENCARKWEGAWWFNDCFRAHLNGRYSLNPNVVYSWGVQWVYDYGYYYSLKRCSMKIRES